MCQNNQGQVWRAVGGVERSAWRAWLLGDSLAVVVVAEDAAVSMASASVVAVVVEEQRDSGAGQRIWKYHRRLAGKGA